MCNLIFISLGRAVNVNKNCHLLVLFPACTYRWGEKDHLVHHASLRANASLAFPYAIEHVDLHSTVIHKLIVIFNSLLS